MKIHQKSPQKFTKKDKFLWKKCLEVTVKIHIFCPRKFTFKVHENSATRTQYIKKGRKQKWFQITAFSIYNSTSKTLWPRPHFVDQGVVGKKENSYLWLAYKIGGGGKEGRQYNRRNCSITADIISIKIEPLWIQ